MYGSFIERTAGLVLLSLKVFKSDLKFGSKGKGVLHFMDEVDDFLEDLSNWYIRRNRRRFWKSENDSDKNAAYYTLHTTLVKYLKIVSPVIPFISDYMYQNLNVSSSK